MRRRVYGFSITIILAGAMGAGAVASTARHTESSRRVSWNSRRGNLHFTASAWKRKDERCVSGGVEQLHAEGAALSTCLPRLGQHPHGVIVLQCALHRAVVAGMARSTTQSARVQPKDRPVVEADFVRAPVLDGATFFAHAFTFRELPARIALRDTAGTIVARVHIAPAPAAPCDDGNSIYRYF